MLIYGAGGHAKVVVDCLIAQQEMVSGVFDDDPAVLSFMGIGVMSFYSEIFRPEEKLIITVGNNGMRKIISGKVSHAFGMVQHPSALVSEHASLGEGTVVFHQAVVQSGSHIGRHVIINTSAVVDHDCHLSDFAHVAPNSTLCGGVKVGEGSLVGASSVILPGISVGRWCTIGAGSVVVKDVPDHAVVAGNPAALLVSD